MPLLLAGSMPVLSTCLEYFYLGGRMDGWMSGWMGGWMDGWMDGWTDGCFDGCLNGQTASNLC